MSLQRVHLIRHAESEANVQKIVCGQLDSPLSAKGKQQALRAKDLSHMRSLLNFRCYTSPLIRCTETAALLGFETLILKPELMETNTGEFSQRKTSEIEAQFPQYQHYATDLSAAYPNGESTQEMISRSWIAFQKIALEDIDECVIVAHGGPLNSICGHLLKIDFQTFPSFLFSNVSVTTFVRVSPHSWCMERMNVC